MSKESNITELDILDADIKLLQQRSSEIRRKLEEVSTSSSARKGSKVLSPAQQQDIIMKRRKKILGGFKKTSLVLIFPVMFFSCVVTKPEPKYKVRSVEHLEKNAYKVVTDSFTVVKIVRGMGKYHPDSVTRRGYSLKRNK